MLVNGSLVGFFRTSKGLRLGDPLSSLIFIMVFEVLSKMICTVESRFIRGFDMGTRGVSISYLQFADDTMIFCEANVKH